MSLALETGTGEGYLARVNSSGRLETSTEVSNTVDTRGAGVQVYTTQANVGTTSGTLLNSRTGRQGLRIQNQGANAVYLRFEAAAATNADWMLAAGAEFIAERVPYAGPVRAIAPGGVTAVVALEFA